MNIQELQEQLKLEDERRAAGLCIACGKPIEDGEEIHEEHLAPYDPQAIDDRHYNIDYPDFIINDIGEREL